MMVLDHRYPETNKCTVGLHRPAVPGLFYNADISSPGDGGRKPVSELGVIRRSRPLGWLGHLQADCGADRSILLSQWKDHLAPAGQLGLFARGRLEPDCDHPRFVGSPIVAHCEVRVGGTIAGAGGA
jgi:hypothetical protein